MTTAELTESKAAIDYAVQKLAWLDINCPVCPNLTRREDIEEYVEKVRDVMRSEDIEALEDDSGYWFNFLLDACADALVGA